MSNVGAFGVMRNSSGNLLSFNPVELAKIVAEAVKDALCINDTVLIDAKHAAEFMGIGKTTWYQLHSEGKVPEPIRLNKRVLWRRKELIAWSEQGCPNKQEWKRILESSAK